MRLTMPSGSLWLTSPCAEGDQRIRSSLQSPYSPVVVWCRPYGTVLTVTLRTMPALHICCD